MDWLEFTFRTGGHHNPELSLTTDNLHNPDNNDTRIHIHTVHVYTCIHVLHCGYDTTKMQQSVYKCLCNLIHLSLCTCGIYTTKLHCILVKV